jgi:2-polyprenyl-3-methyl-5-hydroxy-6-metoxy-1,4-benzoquinol methylase
MKVNDNSNISEADIQKIVDKYSWYHVMNLGFGIYTPGVGFKNLVPVATLLKNIDFKNLKCLDISTFDGKMAFLMEKLGAKQVIATDKLNRETILALIDLFKSKVNFVSGISDRNISKLRDEFDNFDFILCAGLLYHIYSPIELILEVRKLVRNGGYAIFESTCINDEKSLIMRFNRNDIYDDSSTIWVPSIFCLRYMIMYSCFRIVAEATLYETTPRHAILAQAVKPSKLKESNETSDDFLKKVYLKQPNQYIFPQFDWHTFESARNTYVRIKKARNKHIKINPEDTRSYSKEEELLELGTPANLDNTYKCKFPIN